MKTILFFSTIFSIAGCNLLGSSTHPSDTNLENDLGRHVDLEDTKDLSTPDMDDDNVIPKSCSDGLHNGTESDFDCGGRCRPCANSRRCIDGRDCLSEICSSGICVTTEDSCANGVLDEGESEIDCGNELCGPCEIRWWKTKWKRRQPVRFQLNQEADRARFLIKVDGDVYQEDDVRFVMNGELLPSHVDTSGQSSFWVAFPHLDPGEHSLFVYGAAEDSNLSKPSNPWSQDVAVFHSPHLGDVRGVLGTPLMSTTTEAEGWINDATQFDGSNEIVVPDGGNVLNELYPTFTISAWVTPTDGEQMWELIVSRQFEDDSRDDFAFGLSLGRLLGCFENGCIVADTLPLDQWSHVTFVYDGTTAYLYQNGELKTSKLLTRSVAPQNNSLIISGNHNTPTDTVLERFNGIIDELRLTGEVLSPETILSEYEAQTTTFFNFGDVENYSD